MSGFNFQVWKETLGFLKMPQEELAEAEMKKVWLHIFAFSGS